ncbi:MAG: hypothetical protein JW726_11050 [Anaerolineales bacterium]|nr:hypothetical protein [Anaerolineales bacterium]
MTRFLIITISLIGMTLLSACAPTLEAAAPQPTETTVAGPDFTPTLVTALATELKLEAQDIRLISSEKVQWRDSCLGVERKGMMCLEVITPGYLLVFETSQGVFEAHTNGDGTTYLFVPQDMSSTAVPGADDTN